MTHADEDKETTKIEFSSDTRTIYLAINKANKIVNMDVEGNRRLIDVPGN